jgi:hypothetical protein
MKAPARNPKINKFKTVARLLFVPAVTAIDAISFGEYKDIRILDGSWLSLFAGSLDADLSENKTNIIAC